MMALQGLMIIIVWNRYHQSPYRLSSAVSADWKLLLHHLATTGVNLPLCSGICKESPVYRCGRCGSSAMKAPAARSLQQRKRDIPEGADILVTSVNLKAALTFICPPNRILFPSEETD